ncbi:hypothetical protein T265_13156 [Opisthorchis viverrini]|uniref:Uncharacterized protein n=1 Tax=Opisthorchis viverrini TaxID=6198 RepID=A0A075A4Q5_OPIVI|nr:hypothetical protein T265_13156 [Opisthorchis viverrini]KER30560.1 hypothetical protein T265_13156 [Opisthorchis viverrini]
MGTALIQICLILAPLCMHSNRATPISFEDWMRDADKLSIASSAPYKLLKRPWTLPYPLTCCYNNLPCCKKQRDGLLQKREDAYEEGKQMDYYHTNTW